VSVPRFPLAIEFVIFHTRSDRLPPNRAANLSIALRTMSRCVRYDTSQVVTIRSRVDMPEYELAKPLIAIY